MGKKWTFYGRNGIFERPNTVESTLIENPWAESDYAYVVPYYFDTAHSMTAEIELTVRNHLNWMNKRETVRQEQLEEMIPRNKMKVKKKAQGEHRHNQPQKNRMMNTTRAKPRPKMMNIMVAIQEVETENLRRRIMMKEDMDNKR